MPYAPPSVADFRARYPAFANVADPTIAYWLTDAQREADDSWPIATDIAPAQIALAAHNMMVADVDGLASSEIGGLLAKGVTQFRSGSFSASISDEAIKVALAGGYASTAPGLEYLRLLRRNKGGVRVTAPGAAVGDGCFNGSAGLLGYPARLFGG